MEIMIGREPQKEKPRLRMVSGGKEQFLGVPGSVTKKVSRNHCRLEVGEDRRIVSITDVTENNFMYVNGKECKAKKNLSVNDVVELGPDRYRLDLAAVLKAFLGTPTYYIAHLKTAFEEHDKALYDLQVKQGKLTALSGLPGVISMISMVLAVSLPEDLPKARVIGLVVAGFFAVGFIVIRYIGSSKNPVRRKAIDKKFHDEYACPGCGHSFGAKPYDDILKEGQCPWCKSKLVE